MDRFTQALSAQINRNEQSNLFFKDLEKAIVVGQDFLSILETAKTENGRRQIEEKLDAYIGFAVGELIKSILSMNQYVQISPEQRRQAEQIYRNSWEHLKRTKDIRATLYQVHYPGLADWLTKLYPSHFRSALQFQTSLRKLICQEYSPELQLQILGVDMAELKQPVLDIGCGVNANLVKHLRQDNIEIYGFDRLVERESDFVKRGDWFAYEYGEGRWGTIISNAALSNHILYAGKNDTELFSKYRSLLQRILNSLKLQGSLIVAPGNSIISAQITGKSYKALNRQIVGEHYVTYIMRIAR